MVLDEFVRKEIGNLPDGPFWITGQFLKRCFAELLRDRVRAGSNLSEIPHPSGRFFNAQAGGGAVSRNDFAVYDASTTDSSGTTTLKVGVRFGNVTCYKFASGVKPWPSNFVAPSYKYEFAVSADGSAWIKADNDTSGDFNKVTALSLGHGATPPDPTDDTGYLVLGNWAVTGSPAKLTILTSDGVGSQFYNLCGTGHFWGPS